MLACLHQSPAHYTDITLPSISFPYPVNIILMPPPIIPTSHCHQSLPTACQALFLPSLLSYSGPMPVPASPHSIPCSVSATSIVFIIVLSFCSLSPYLPAFLYSAPLFGSCYQCYCVHFCSSSPDSLHPTVLITPIY